MGINPEEFKDRLEKNGISNIYYTRGILENQIESDNMLNRKMQKYANTLL